MARRVQELCARRRRRVRREGRARLDRSERRRRPAKADRSAPGIRRDEDHRARLGAGAAVRCRGRAGARARPSRASATSTRPRRSPSTRPRSAPTRPRCAPPRRPGDSGHRRPDRARDADGRRPDARRDRPRASRRSSQQARTILDIALYDVRFETDAGALVLAALLAARAARGRGPPRSTTSTTPVRSRCRRLPRRRPRRSKRSRSRRAGSPGFPDLMHHKFVVRDGDGRLDGLDELDRRLVVAAGERHRPRRLPRRRATRITLAFERAVGERQRSSTRAGRAAAGGRRLGAEVRAWFRPEHGEALSHRVAKHLGKARKRVRIASPVLTSGPILGTLVEVVNERRCDVAGVVDDTQVDQVFGQWRDERRERVEDPAPAARARGRAVLRQVVDPVVAGRRSTTSCTRRSSSPTTRRSSGASTSRARASGTRRTCSRSTTPAIADRLAAFVDEVRGRYPRATVPA